MARPMEIRFFEVPLPKDLSPDLEWLRSYHHNSEQLIKYLIDHGAGNTAYYAAIKSLTLLKDHLIKTKEAYSVENAASWFAAADTQEKGTVVTLHRLSDLYQYGSVQPLHAFPSAFPYYNGLSTLWQEHLDAFLATLSKKESSIIVTQRCISRFLYRMQEKGIHNPQQLNFSVLEEYCNSEVHNSHNGTARYTYVIGDFILFLADKNDCPHGLGWYPYFWMHGRVLLINDLSADQVNRIDTVRNESLNFPSEDFASVIPDFLKRFQEIGYSVPHCAVAKYTLYNLLLFLEMHDLGYHPDIAEVWLEDEMRRHKSQGWKQHRRVLHLFEVYTLTGDIIPQQIFREKALLCERLPEWCKTELDAFLKQKAREGWEESTLDMFRSSVTRFCTFLCSLELQSFSELTAAAVSAFNQADKHLTAEGKNAYNTRIRQFLQFLERRQIIPFGLHLALFCVSAPTEKIVVTLSKDELAEIKRVYSSCNTPKKLRDKAMVLLGTKMGIRASDIVKIELADINWEAQSIRIFQKKTEHEITLPMPVTVSNAIYLYIINGRPSTRSSFLFLSHRAPFFPLTRSVCTRALKDALPFRNVPGSGFHVTRKTFATEQLKKGVARQIISELLGHRDTSSLGHYLYMDKERMLQCPLPLADVNLAMEENRYGI